MTRKKVVIIGLVFFVTIILFIWGYNFLKGKSAFHREQVYYTLYNDVGGLNVGSPVTFKGFKVGIIDKIEFSDDIGSKVVVTVFINKNFKIPKESKAEIYNVDLLGTKGLRINPSKSKEYYQPGDTIASSIEKSMIDEFANNLGPLKRKTEDLAVTLDSAIKILNRIIINNEDNLNMSFDNINKISSDLEDVTAEFKQMMSKPNGKLQLLISELESVGRTLKKSEPQLKNAIDNFSDISDSVAASNLKSTLLKTGLVIDNLKGITDKINNGQGSMGQLLNNDSLYINLDDMIKKLNFLIEDIQQNPRKYLRMSVIDLSKNTNK